MDENLERLVRQLRSDTCPQRVLDEVARRVASETRSSGRLSFRVAVVVTSVVVLCAIALWRWPAGGNHGQPKPGVPATTDSARVAQEAEVALGCIGEVLRYAGDHSETLILKGAVPPLRNSLQTAKNKIVDHI